MHTDLYATLDKMTVSPNPTDGMSSSRDLGRRSAFPESKRRHRQVRVQLSIYGTPRLAPGHVSFDSPLIGSATDTFTAHLLADQFLIHIFPRVRPHPRTRSRNDPPPTRRRRCRMAVSPFMGFPRKHKRRAESHAGACADEHGDTAQGQAGEVIVRGSSEKIVNIIVRSSLL
jgi:hypothetical protein